MNQRYKEAGQQLHTDEWLLDDLDASIDLFCKNFFSKTMWWDFFLEVMQYIRFDIRATRRGRLENDKFASILKTWLSFITNCKIYYNSGKILLTNYCFLLKPDAVLYNILQANLTNLE